MAKMIDDIRERLLDHVLSLEEIDSVLEENKYFPIETDEDDIDTLKYSNNKSQIDENVFEDRKIALKRIHNAEQKYPQVSGETYYEEY